MYRHTFCRAIWTLLLAMGPMGMACELALDFDRTPLQPVYEAGTEEEGDGEEGPGTSDARADGPASRPDGSGDSGGTRDAGEAGLLDSGSDSGG